MKNRISRYYESVDTKRLLEVGVVIGNIRIPDGLESFLSVMKPGICVDLWEHGPVANYHNVKGSVFVAISEDDVLLIFPLDERDAWITRKVLDEKLEQRP